MAKHSSKASCECIIAKYEALNVEEGRSLAELLTTDLVLKRHLKLNRRAKQFARECHSAIA
jgi:hypothetical protein